jgi:hypothetical protein
MWRAVGTKTGDVFVLPVIATRAKDVTRRRIVTFLVLLAFAILARFVTFAVQNTDLWR